MRVVVVGAGGVVGMAVAEELATTGHEVLRASRSGELKVDLARPDSITKMYESVGQLDAVVSCAGEAVSGSVVDLTDEQIAFSLASKLVGQLNLVRLGLDKVASGAAFVLTAGIYGQHPEPGVAALSLVNGALESFARAAALDLPRGLRIATISPPYLTETALEMGRPTEGTISAAVNARYYRDFVEGNTSGKVIYPKPDH